MSNDKPTRDQMVDMIGEAIGNLLKMRAAKPVAYVINTNAMALLVTITTWLELNKPLEDEERKRMIKWFRIIISDAASLTEEQLDTIQDSLELGQQQENWEKASSTDEWINCY